MEGLGLEGGRESNCGLVWLGRLRRGKAAEALWQVTRWQVQRSAPALCVLGQSQAHTSCSLHCTRNPASESPHGAP